VPLGRAKPGAPNTFGSRKGDEAGIVGIGELGRPVGRVRTGERYGTEAADRGGEFDHDGLMLLGDNGSIVWYGKVRVWATKQGGGGDDR
jgi:hypothetical protein